MIGAHSDCEYLKTVAMTHPNTKMYTARDPVNDPSRIHPGMCAPTNSADEMTADVAKPKRS